MVFKNKHKPKINIDIKIDDTSIAQVETAKFLGLSKYLWCYLQGTSISTFALTYNTI